MKELQIGQLSNILLNQIEFLAMNGHSRDKLQKDYSIKQIFFYSQLVRRQKNIQLAELASVFRNTIQSAQVGDTKGFEKLLEELNK